MTSRPSAHYLPDPVRVQAVLSAFDLDHTEHPYVVHALLPLNIGIIWWLPASISEQQST